jgi:hypothetical protein
MRESKMPVANDFETAKEYCEAIQKFCDEEMIGEGRVISIDKRGNGGCILDGTEDYTIELGGILDAKFGIKE